MPQHSPEHHRVTTAATEMLLISDAALPAVNAELRYHCDDPFAVQMLLSVDQSPVITWVFGRELLIDGISMPAGIGDVQVFPTRDGVIIELRSGSVSARLLAHSPDLAEFAAGCVAQVPLGEEMNHYDFDADLRTLPVHDSFEA
ncbi:SsgA family sporulation/cell division regulator [Nakamurella sp. GG22]